MCLFLAVFTQLLARWDVAIDRLASSRPICDSPVGACWSFGKTAIGRIAACNEARLKLNWGGIASAHGQNSLLG
jgi:hypothetical protein